MIKGKKTATSCARPMKGTMTKTVIAGRPAPKREVIKRNENGRPTITRLKTTT